MALCGINEFHHTVSNQMLRDDNHWTYFAQQLKQISDQFHVAHWLDYAVECAQTRN